MADDVKSRWKDDSDVESGTQGQEMDVSVSPDELRAGELSAENCRLGTLLLHTRGYVILRGAIPPAVVATADEAFAGILEDCRASRDGHSLRLAGMGGIKCRIGRQTQTVFWERNHRWRVFPRLQAPFNNPWILANPLAIQLLQRLLSKDFKCKFVSSDTCMNGAEIQSPHREMDPGTSWEPPAYLVNIPLHRCDLRNGPLEIWPCGSHLWHDDVIRELGFDDTVQDGLNPELERLASLFPSRRVVLERGDLVIRDPALMHRGTVNHTDKPRTMLTVCYIRAGLTHNYGRLDLSLDRELYERLAPEIRHLFESFESPAAV
jgi:ectoine hydroxylase-related dioxygenase (phytanoyl-CoA dioxygenase family)